MIQKGPLRQDRPIKDVQPVAISLDSEWNLRGYAENNVWSQGLVFIYLFVYYSAMPLLPRKAAVKDLKFRGSSLKQLCEFPKDARREAGYQHEAGIFRVLYVAKFEDAVYVLHCFQKKTQRTAKSDLDLARKQYAELVQEQKR
jgi:phage-related protein